MKDNYILSNETASLKSVDKCIWDILMHTTDTTLQCFKKINKQKPVGYGKLENNNKKNILDSGISIKLNRLDYSKYNFLLFSLCVTFEIYWSYSSFSPTFIDFSAFSSCNQPYLKTQD